MRPEGLDALERVLRGYGSVMVALSGGVDSSLLARVAFDVLSGHAVAVTVASPLVAADDVETARRVAAGIGIAHRVVELDVLADPRLAANPPDRCYVCKKAILGRLIEEARRDGIAHVCVGENLDDDDQHRPGRRAAVELGVEFPLQEARLTKADVRRIARALDLPVAARPPSPCLATRIPYGIELDRNDLGRIEAAESALRRLGLSVVRVRHHGPVARLETSPAELAVALEKRTQIVQELRRLGWTWVTLDLTGYELGSMDRGLQAT